MAHGPVVVAVAMVWSWPPCDATSAVCPSEAEVPVKTVRAPPIHGKAKPPAYADSRLVAIVVTDGGAEATS